jgi:DNA replication protein DnaC
MIITSNHRTGDEVDSRKVSGDSRLERPLTLRDRLGDALMSRLYEMCRILEVKGKGDYRLHMQKADIPR